MKNHPATLKKRFAALALDYFIIVAYGLCLFGITILFYTLTFGGIPDVMNVLGRSGSQLLGFMTLTLPIGLYFYFTESSRRHATFGKRIAKIQVQNTLPGPLFKKQIAVRTIFKLLPWEFAHTFIYQIVYYSQNEATPPLWVMIGLAIANILPLLYVSFVILRKDHRAPHDLIAKTVVNQI